MKLTVSEQPWIARAACRGLVDLFFSRNKRDQQKAYKICDTCPVLEECQEFALTNPGCHGIWGGLSEKQRVAIRRSRRLRQRDYK
jgi:WhiB family transcriptional regulator, redox-sensing transcriptional regulator